MMMHDAGDQVDEVLVLGSNRHLRKIQAVSQSLCGVELIGDLLSRRSGQPVDLVRIKKIG
ncbi:hypothetical protein [Pseudoruegeria sp. SK021]|uniref:hypothetical protein n=1 Tax=Pseudoruegeria sp. SK021 TaxID=1933035 RepID=UPI00111C02D5|nr:hypothetical protein [Pseudoruegeria sp. SK021]